jgi:thiosulfate/3-mercaptopyruvate sulfurtransferase
MGCIATMVWVAAVALAVPHTVAPALLVPTGELARMLNDPSVVVLHVTDRAASFEQGHIPGAQLLRYGDFAVEGRDGLGSELPPVDQLERVFEAVGVSDDSRVVVYGNSPVAAARAFFTLDVLGHRRVALLDGGLRAWRAENRPIETGAGRHPARAGQFTPRLDTRRIADAAFIQQRFLPPAPRVIALIDVRPDPEFVGTDEGHGGAHAAGHIPGARQLPWDTLVAADGRFLPRAGLEARLRRAGAAPGKPVVSYCMVGMRASVVYFVARYLGYDARLYDGSIIDWSRRRLPVKTGRQ